jgi:hypothetical protein
LPRARPARRCGAINFGGTRTNDSPASSSARSSARVSCRQSSTAQERSPGSELAQASSSQAVGAVDSANARPASSTAIAVSDCLCTSTPITIIQIASSNVGGDRRADRPQLRQQPSSYQVTLGGLGKAAATQRWQVNPRGDMRE